MGMHVKLPDDAQITLTKKALDELLEEAKQAGRYNLLQDVKERLGFSRHISFDNVPAIVKGWKEAAESIESQKGQPTP